MWASMTRKRRNVSAGMRGPSYGTSRSSKATAGQSSITDNSRDCRRLFIILAITDCYS